MGVLASLVITQAPWSVTSLKSYAAPARQAYCAPSEGLLNDVFAILIERDVDLRHAHHVVAGLRLAP
ncbi:hypothetical protein [Burkholderia cenocepacia]|uniref:hypothetical protein n=1 Tax=Burkholderia cenocepacia TaxID=95486 RepID=UPI0013DF1651|nr:hypothetical protein [Burkholderia cenocepacia]